MTSDQLALLRSGAGCSGQVERAFRAGRAIALRCRRAPADITQALRQVDRYLTTFSVEQSFRGTDGLQADRQSFWVASKGLGQGLCRDPADIASLDGDASGGARGIETLRSQPQLTESLLVLKDELDRALLAAMTGLRLAEELPREILDAVTVRYRAIRYAPANRDVAGIGLHPDGNLISALITNQPGLAVVSGPGQVVRPAPEAGVIVMPGSILTRWSDGALLPTVHGVEIRRGDPVKCTIVGFLNFADGSEVPRSRRFTDRSQPFRNEVQAFKEDDMRPDGDLAEFYRARGFVVTEDGRSRFLTFAELTRSS
jgi:2-oxoglutarate-Fe(II)-dependent oxygenase superfamily protein